jgi:hypothetical protein
MKVRKNRNNQRLYCTLYHITITKKSKKSFIIPAGEWEKNPRLQAKTSVCSEGAKERNIPRLKAAVFTGCTLQASAGGG